MRRTRTIKAAAAPRSSARSKRMKKNEPSVKTIIDENQNEILTLSSDGSKTEQLNFYSSPHPLLIPMLASIIINFINPDLQSLKQLRLVCTSWYESSLHLWRRKLAVLTIVPDSSAFTSPDSHSLQFSTFLQEYLDPLSFHRFAQRPFSKYKLRNFTIDIKVCDGQLLNQQAKTFWDFIGPLMEYVHFEKCTFLGNVDSPFHQLLIRKIPNLSELALTRAELQQAVVKTGHFKEKFHPTLKSLTVYQEINMVFAKLIGLPLQSAVLNLIPFPHPITVFHAIPTLTRAVENNSDFFKSVCDSLETLEIFLPPLTIQNSPISLNTVTLGCLRELHLLGLVCHNFDFLDFTPVLEKLCIDLSCYGKREEIRKMIEDSRRSEDEEALFRYDNNKHDLTSGYGMEDFNCLHLSSLEIDFEFKEKGIRLLGSWMPRLRVLKTVLGERTVGVVSEIWGDFLVELVCGFGSKVENKMFYGEVDRHARSKDKKNISDLKRLERFQFDAFCGKSKLTDHAVSKGLLKMSTLKFVQICVGPKMSVDAEQALKNAIGECRVIRNYSPEDGGDHGDYECCSRRTFLEEAGLSFGQVVNDGNVVEAGLI